MWGGIEPAGGGDELANLQHALEGFAGGFSLDTYTSPSLKDQAAHRPVREDGSPMILDDATQGFRQIPGATFRDGPATALPPGNERVGEQTGARSLGWLQCSFCEPDHPRLDMPVFKGGVDDVPC